MTVHGTGGSSYYDLAQTENRLMVRCLLGQEPDDMPFTLAKILLSEDIQKHFDMVIIDAPPRLTTAAIQALCSSTHVLVPTILDELSAEAVTTFLSQIEALRTAGLCPHIRYAGIVASMVGQGGNPGDVITKMKDAIHELRVSIKVLESQIKDAAAFAKVAGSGGIAYIQANSADRTRVREMIIPLGRELRPILMEKRV